MKQSSSKSEFRWRLDEEVVASQPPLFALDDVVERRKGVGEFGGLEFLHVRARSIINEVKGPSPMPFRFTINAYRGCSHACAYCFARPTHEYLNLNSGSDFDSKIVVKINAVERLVAELKRPTWHGDGIAMGTNTDPYQRCEGKYQLTRGIIETLRDARNPFSVLTKSTLILRDLDLIADAAQNTDVQCSFSIATLDAEVWKKTEPGTPHPRLRVAALKRLSEAGVDTGVLVAPVLPGISDAHDQIARVVDACVSAGAEWIGVSALHLRSGVKEHWMQWLQSNYPSHVDRYERLYGARANLPAKQQREILAKGRDLVAKARIAQNAPVAVRRKRNNPSVATPIKPVRSSTQQLSMQLPRGPTTRRS